MPCAAGKSNRGAQRLTGARGGGIAPAGRGCYNHNMFDPITFIIALVTIIALAGVMALALLVTLRLFSLEKLEFQPLLFITLMGNLLAGGLGYVVLVVLAKSATMREVVIGTHSVPTTVIAMIWLVLLLIIFFGLMVCIAGKISFAKALGAVTLAVLLVGCLMFLVSLLVIIVMGVSPDAVVLHGYLWLKDLPARMAGTL